MRIWFISCRGLPIFSGAPQTIGTQLNLLNTKLCSKRAHLKFSRCNFELFFLGRQKSTTKRRFKKNCLIKSCFCDSFEATELKGMFFSSANPGGQKTLSQVTCLRWFYLTQFNLIQHQKNDIEQKIAAKVLCFPKNNPCPVFLPQVFELKNHENFHEIHQKHWPKKILTKKRSHFWWFLVVHRKLQILAPIKGLHCWCHWKFMMGKIILNQPESERI